MGNLFFFPLVWTDLGVVFNSPQFCDFKIIFLFFSNLAMLKTDCGFTSKPKTIIERMVGLSACKVQGLSEQTIAFISNFVHQALLTSILLSWFVYSVLLELL